MKSIYYITLSSILLLTSCGGKETKTDDITLINGGRTYGGELVFSNSEEINETFPLAAANKHVISISSQIYETLLNIEPTTLKVIPGIATDFSSNDAGDVYTFKIRKGVYFHEDACFGGKGRELTPEDVKYSLDFACSGSELNKDENSLVNKIKGASEFKASSTKSFPKDGVPGIKVKGDAVEITLNKPFIGFEELLTRKNIVIFPKEAIEKYGNDIKTHPVGTGPFKLEKMDKNGIRLVRNDSYWQKDEFGNQLPYLSSILLKYIPSKKEEMLAFRNKDIDLLLDIPADEIENVLGTLQEAMAGKNVKHKVESSQSLNIEYIGFNTAEGVFASKDVREAFVYAVDPSELIEKYIGGDGYPATNGFVPEIEGTNNQTPSPAVNPEKARKLLAQAGYANGNNFPETVIYVNGVEGSKNEALIKGYCAIIKRELNVNLSIKLCTLTEREAAISNGEAKIWRAGWIADYPSPLSFLENFYSNNNVANQFRYSNDEFNTNYQAAQLEKDARKRGYYFIKAQSKIAQDAVVAPLVVNNMLFMVNARVKGVKANILEDLNFKDAYIKPSVNEDNN
ncbi:MAG: ABC transporter substrate-binding protein [Crocinitomicaceae bacterium]|nr:ABC transporter substrate-binding protein [Crocinitomicaceae bacterium]